MYGLRESPRDWYECFNDYMIEVKFERSKYDYCLYTGMMNGEKLYLILYVDDLLICGSSMKAISELKSLLQQRFRMKDLGQVQNYVGIEIEYFQDKGELFLCQEKYIESLAERYQIKNSKKYDTPMEINLKLEPAKTADYSIKYRNLIGALLFISSGIRPDIAFSVNYLSRFQASYNHEHYQYALRILKYLYGTKSLKLIYNSIFDLEIDAYVDADWASDVVDRTSTTGILIRVFENVIMWKTNKQKVVSRASTHAEYYALANCVEEVLPIRGILSDFDVQLSGPVPIFEDNTGAIALAKGGKFKTH